jgi:hypothetical protein
VRINSIFCAAIFQADLEFKTNNVVRMHFMKIKHQLSIATLIMAGLFATGCSQQSAGGSQVAGGSQSQIEGGSQTAGGSQQASSQQQIDKPAVVETRPVVSPPRKAPPGRVAPPKRRMAGNCHTHPANSLTKSIRHCHPNPRGHHRYGGAARHGGSKWGRWTHTHPAVPGCTKSIRHTHKYKNARHSHHYSCKGKRHYTARRADQWGHTHAAIPNCTNSYRHSHRYSKKNHTHHYSCKGGRPAYSGGKVDVYALQRKLKAKGYYKGPIDGIVGPGTRSALKRFMNR